MQLVLPMRYERAPSREEAEKTSLKAKKKQHCVLVVLFDIDILRFFTQPSFVPAIDKLLQILHILNSIVSTIFYFFFKKFKREIKLNYSYKIKARISYGTMVDTFASWNV